MSCDGLIEFEESYFDRLIEKFIGKYKDEWNSFVYDEYSNNMPEPDIDDVEERN